MDKRLLKEYFQFTRNERISIVLLLVIILITGIIPVFLNNGTIEPQPSLVSYEEGIRQLEGMTDRSNRGKAEEREDFSDHPVASYSSSISSLFMFDPNTISEAGWKKLGVREKTITTIRKYLAKGGRFRKPEDISKIYGLNEKDIYRLMPYVKINVEEINATFFDTTKGYNQKNSSQNNTKNPLTLTIDINEADTSLFIKLPGIGSKLALRIINFREKLGGFYSVDQVGETFGIADSVFQKFKSRLICGTITIKKININTASAADLNKHPYINWSLANAIVQFRTQHGYFKTIAELEQLQLLDQGQLAKLLPYLSVE